MYTLEAQESTMLWRTAQGSLIRQDSIHVQINDQANEVAEENEQKGKNWPSLFPSAARLYRSKLKPTSAHRSPKLGIKMAQVQSHQDKEAQIRRMELQRSLDPKKIDGLLARKRYAELPSQETQHDSTTNQRVYDVFFSLSRYKDHS